MTTLSIHERSRSLPYRAAIFAFGVVAYALGVGALVALILIMLGVLPFTGGPIGKLPTGAGLALDLALLVAFGLQHSVMARPKFKARWTRVVPVAAERATYLLATALALLPLLLLWQPMPAVVWSAQAPALRWLLSGVAVAGWTYLLAASFAINHFELFGLQQVYQALRNRPLTQPPFQVRWMYRFDRHPIMTGILIGLWATPTMTVDHLLFALGTTVYVWIGVFFEERSLRRQLGRPYEEYCQRVRSIVPTFKGGRETPAAASVRPSATSEWKSS
jgi:protein-S-isoprenylcysteine O-methyltransferase Ste14